MKNSFLPSVVLAVWIRRSRSYPLVLHFPKRFGVTLCDGIEVAADGIRFDDLAAEAKQTFGISRADFEKAYRVRQLSRVGDTTKPQAATPKTLSREVAPEFLSQSLRVPALSRRSHSPLRRDRPR